MPLDFDFIYLANSSLTSTSIIYYNNYNITSFLEISLFPSFINFY